MEFMAMNHHPWNFRAMNIYLLPFLASCHNFIVMKNLFMAMKDLYVNVMAMKVQLSNFHCHETNEIKCHGHEFIPTYFYFQLSCFHCHEKSTNGHEKYLINISWL